MSLIHLPLLLCGMFLFAAVPAGQARAQETAKFQIGRINVWAVADSVGERDMSVFKVDPALWERYVPGGQTPSGVMTFVLGSGGKNILIDTGHGRPESQLRPGLKAIGLTPGEIDLVIISHMHGDHIGGLIDNGSKSFPKAEILISRLEHDFWVDPENPARYPGRDSNFALARQVVELYGPQVQLFDFDQEIVPGLKALEAAGHTPGHSAFLIESDQEKLLCVSDLLHAAALQMPRPDINATYDMNPQQAQSSRQRLLKYAAEEKIPIAGMHLPFPALGRVLKNSEGGYQFKTGLE